jgi:1-acyl-sn-glycerol-3-phosphate acyltransferase
MLLAARYLVLGIYLIVVSLLFLVIVLVNPFSAFNTQLVAIMIGRPCLFILGMKIKINDPYGELDKTYPRILISNHQHNFDIFLCSAVLPKRTVSLGKKDIVFIPFFGIIYWLSGNILIDRFNIKKSLKSMGQVAIKIKERDVSVWIMPEGTRSRGRGLLPFKKGAFRTAIGGGIDIVPVTFSEYVHSCNFNKWDAGVVSVDVDTAIKTSELSFEDLDSLKEQSYNIISRRLNKTHEDRSK